MRKPSLTLSLKGVLAESIILKQLEETLVLTCLLNENVYSYILNV